MNFCPPILAALLMSFSAVPGLSAVPGPDEALDLAWERFLKAGIEERRAVVAEIDQCARASDHEALASLVKRCFNARRRAGAKQVEPPTFYDPKVYATKEAEAGRAVRSFLDPTDRQVEELSNLYRPWDNMPPFHTELRYDFVSGSLRTAEQGLMPNARLENALDGWPPYADALIASLCEQWDCRRKEFEALAEHFGHAYCDLKGQAYPNITIYDALASQEGLDMPDIDVIPFARLILKDRSYRSPIPPGSRRDRLYRKIKDDFLPYFQHRSFVETAALLYVYPDSEFRARHEGLRENLLYTFAVFDEDPRKVLGLLKRGSDRGGFMDETLQLVKKDLSWRGKCETFRRQRLDTRWEMHRIAREVLTRHGMLREK